MNGSTNYLRKSSSIAALMLGAALLVSTSQAQIVVLTDGGSEAKVDVGSDQGMNYWSVNGQNQLKQQWFYYRVDNGAQQAINSIGTASYVNDTANHLNTTYANGNYGVSIDYLLTGSGVGSGQADISEGITLHNFSANPITFNFYQYSHFVLLGDPTANTVTMDQTYAYQQLGATGVAEGIVAPDATFFEAGTYGVPGNTLDKLNNTTGLNLNNNGAAGPGDVTWAFQWTITVDPHSDQTIAKDKLLYVATVPEPSALALLGMGMSVLLLRRRGQG